VGVETAAEEGAVCGGEGLGEVLLVEGGGECGEGHGDEDVDLARGMDTTVSLCSCSAPHWREMAQRGA
tara:strand:- start:5880 stop:6083 length:204 start_codon:yes stop_codon:yes gene_type:complete